MSNDNTFRDTLLQAPVGITILRGRDLVVEMANATYLAIVDRTAAGFIGRPLFDSLPEVTTAVGPIMQAILDTGAPYYGTAFEVLLNRFGRIEKAYFNFVYQPLREADGAISGIMVVATEVTGQVEANQALRASEEKFRRLANELEQRVEERTRELQRSNEDLSRSNNELMTFAYVASHDLQEPLRKIQAFTSRLMEFENERLSDKGKDYFSRVQASAKRMQQLIIDLLTFSRVNTGKKHFELTDLNVLLATVLEQLKETIEQKNAVIGSTPLPTLLVIPFQFEQLFTNLLSNSLKFSQPGIPPVVLISASVLPGVAIKASGAGADPKTSGIDPNKNYHVLEFSDNGIGFDNQFAERIFQVFQRLHRKEDFEGTGIGLSICKKIVNNHQGMMMANGKPGAGSVFSIYIVAS